jgi:hypothetical protein
MQWSKISVDLLLDRIPDADLVAIVKYQLLWAHLEHKPTDAELRRWLSKDKLARVQEYIDSISNAVRADIDSVILRRGRQKSGYLKSKELREIPSIGHSAVHIAGSTNASLPQMNSVDYNKEKRCNVPQSIGSVFNKILPNKGKYKIDNNLSFIEMIRCNQDIAIIFSKYDVDKLQKAENSLKEKCAGRYFTLEKIIEWIDMQM